ncbi:hypothetical protein QWY74_12970 [Halomonas almeriensis]|uniref:hypothetical protein n=1 Tax=Halomonas almeriensis TaxID=308163 RepID=UPI0025B5F910|nr:hypothetical protein [Halomonas almeriensis]MDN3554354.1 hypothetical protein [Halomonas almeriensis]
MATLYGLHRSTLYEAVDKGRVTAQVNGKGQKVLDLSEMIRVYGEPPGQTALTQQNPTPSSDNDPTPTTERLLAELVELTRHQGEELRRLREEVATLRRLPPPGPDQGDPEQNPTDTQDPDPPDNGDPHGLRSLARSLYQDGDAD